MQHYCFVWSVSTQNLNIVMYSVLRDNVMKYHVSWSFPPTHFSICFYVKQRQNLEGPFFFPQNTTAPTKITIIIKYIPFKNEWDRSKIQNLHLYLLFCFFHWATSEKQLELNPAFASLTRLSNFWGLKSTWQGLKHLAKVSVTQVASFQRCCHCPIHQRLWEMGNGGAVKKHNWVHTCN